MRCTDPPQTQQTTHKPKKKTPPQIKKPHNNKGLGGCRGGGGGGGDWGLFCWGVQSPQNKKKKKKKKICLFGAGFRGGVGLVGGGVGVVGGRGVLALWGVGLWGGGLGVGGGFLWVVDGCEPPKGVRVVVLVGVVGCGGGSSIFLQSSPFSEVLSVVRNLYCFFQYRLTRPQMVPF